MPGSSPGRRGSQAEVRGDVGERCVPTDADVVGRFGRGFVEIAALGGYPGQPGIAGEAGRDPGVGAAGQRAGWRWREGRVEIVAELAGPQVLAGICAVAGDVALTERVAAEEVVDADRDAVVEAPVAGELVGHGQDDEVVQDATVGAPVPTGRRCVRLSPGLPALKVQQALPGIADTGGHPVVIR